MTKLVSFRQPKWLLALAVVLLLFGASRSEAGFQAAVRFTGSGVDHTEIIYGSSSANYAYGGDIIGTVNYMGYRVNVSGYTLQSEQLSLLSQTTTEAVRTSSASTALTIQVITYDDTFTAPAAGQPVWLNNDFTGTNLTAGTKSNPKTATSYGFLADQNGAGEVDTLGQTFIGIGPSNYSAPTSSVKTTIPSSPFKLGNSLTISGLTQFGDAASVTVTTSVVAVPTPPGAILLLSALPLGGLFYLRRRRKA